MSLSQLAGAVSGLLAVALALLGLLFLLPAAVRLLFVIRRPGKGRLARAFAVGGLVLLLCGTLLFLAADLTSEYPSFRHLLDAVALWVAALMFLAAIVVAVRAGRRRPAPRPAGASSAAEQPPAPGGEATPEPPPPAARDR